MAESPASQVYSPGILGDAVVLGSGLGPLTVLRQEAAARARAKAAAAKLKQQQEDSDARNLVPVTADGWGVHNEQLSKLVQEKLALNKADYQNDALTLYDKKSRSFGRANEAKQAADASNEMKANHAATMATAKAEPRYDSAKVDKAFMDTLYNLDPETGRRGTDIPIPQVDIKKQQNVLDQTDVLNKGEVYKKFITGLADAENIRIGKAALPGGFGNTTVFDSNIFAHDKDGNALYNADRSSVIHDMPRLLARMQDDPFVRKVLQQDAIDNQRAAGSQQMMSGSPQMDGYSQLSAAQNAQMQALPTAGAQQTQVNAATDISRYGKTKTSSIQSYRSRPQPRQAALKANQATATDTDGFTLDAPIESVPTSSTVYNDGSSQMLRFAHPDTPKFVTNGTKEVPYTTHYATVGTTFATSKNPHITLAATTDGISTLGADGEASKYYGTSTNTMTEFKANSRYMVLTLDGKRIPGQGEVGTQTGERAQAESLSRLSPADRKRVKYKPMYEGSVADKPKTSGDGAGSAAKIIGYKDGNGTAIPDAMVPAFEKAGMKLFPQYDQTLTMRRAIHDATPQMDAQAMAQTPNYNPRILTPAQARISKLVDDGGGETLSPYRPARVERAAPQATASAPLYTPKGTAPTPAAPKAAAVEVKANTNSSYYTKRKK